VQARCLLLGIIILTKTKLWRNLRNKMIEKNKIIK
jgi:hypothetical protein